MLEQKVESEGWKYSESSFSQKITNINILIYYIKIEMTISLHV